MRGGQTLAPTDRPLHGNPAQVPTGHEDHAAPDGKQGERGCCVLDVEGVDELANGNAAGEQAESRAHPRQEGPLVGQREAVVGLLAVAGVYPPP